MRAQITVALLALIAFNQTLAQGTARETRFVQSSNARFSQSNQAVTAPLTLTLSDQAEDAINSGVSLSINADYAMRNSYWLFSTSSEVKTHNFTLLRHTLSKRFIVNVSGETQPHIFRSITQATNYISARALILWESYASSEAPFSMRLSLNRFDLPAPMRLNAFISSAWEIDTGWLEWQSED